MSSSMSSCEDGLVDASTPLTSLSAEPPSERLPPTPTPRLPLELLAKIIGYTTCGTLSGHLRGCDCARDAGTWRLGLCLLCKDLYPFAIEYLYEDVARTIRSNGFVRTSFGKALMRDCSRLRLVKSLRFTSLCKSSEKLRKRKEVRHILKSLQTQEFHCEVKPSELSMLDLLDASRLTRLSVCLAVHDIFNISNALCLQPWLALLIRCADSIEELYVDAALLYKGLQSNSPGIDTSPIRCPKLKILGSKQSATGRFYLARPRPNTHFGRLDDFVNKLVGTNSGTINHCDMHIIGFLRSSAPTPPCFGRLRSATLDLDLVRSPAAINPAFLLLSLLPVLETLTLAAEPSLRPKCFEGVLTGHIKQEFASLRSLNMATLAQKLVKGVQNGTLEAEYAGNSLVLKGISDLRRACEERHILMLL